ncbi:MAG: hypothetical protein RMJ38_00050 [candidate division WOR-3 bacterium]|nr:hypothetical protein [candidate division WOR-3 bacterium]MDW8149826.1 hypothetical protein [candidate division WOR-3 bacterium]
MNLYRRFLIYKSIKEGKDIDYILQTYNISKGTVYKIKNYGFIKIRPKELKVIEYVEKNPFKSINEISTELNLSKVFVYRTLKKYNIFVFKDADKNDLTIINFLIQKNDIDNLIKFAHYYHIIVPYDVIAKLKNIPLELEIFKIDYEITQIVKKPDDLLYEIEEYLNKLKERNYMLSYYFALSSKFDIFILKGEYSKIINYYDEKFDKLLSLTVKSRLYNSLSNAYSFIDANKALNIIKKQKKIYRKLNLSQKRKVLKFVEAFYYNLGYFKKSYRLSRKGSLINILSAYAMGKYQEVISRNYISNNKLESFIINYAKAISYLFLSDTSKAMTTMSNAYKEMGENLIPNVAEFYYTFLIVYHRFLNTKLDLEIFEELKSVLGNNINKHFYAIVTGDISHLEKSPKDLVIKYWISGRVNRAIELASRFGIRTILYLLLLFQPKSFSKIKKYKILKDFIKFAKKESIKIFFLRKRPYFILRNKKHYLKTKGIHLALIELFYKCSLPAWKLSKNELRILKYRLKIPIFENKGEIVLNANVHTDINEALLSIEANNLKRAKKLFKSIPFAIEFHPYKVLNEIIEKSKYIKGAIAPIE